MGISGAEEASIVLFDDNFPTTSTGLSRIQEIFSILEMIWKAQPHTMISQHVLKQQARQAGELTVYGFIRESTNFLSDDKQIPKELQVLIIKYYPFPDVPIYKLNEEKRICLQYHGEKLCRENDRSRFKMMLADPSEYLDVAYFV